MRIHTDYFLTQMGRQWGWVVFRGLIALVFAALAFMVPASELDTLTPIWGAYAVADGFLALLMAYQVRESNRPWWSLALVGISGICAGLVIFGLPGATTLGLPSLVATWSLAMGVFQIVAALRMRKSIAGEWRMILSGALAVLFGLLMFVLPSGTALTAVWLIAGYAIVFGVLVVAFGLRLRSVVN
ncbi:HdeD family acid-resistance protein [Rhodoferax sp.]|uniref:HdeD family acid-resistance protein n=1 Tax=Rhodoferax sp. TaxID=50421 RepID=UPI00374DEFDD